MSTTYLAAVNAVLVRLREDEVASVDQDDYSKLVGRFVTQAVSEIEDSWDWVINRTTIQVVTQAGTYNYGLTGAGTSFKVFQVFEDTEDYELEKAPSYQQMNRWLLNNNPQSGPPEYWDWNGQDSNGDPVANLYPIPDMPYTLNFNMKIKSQLSLDTDTFSVPLLPVELRALQLAIEERGEDGGDSANDVGRNADNALANAIVFDGNMYENETDWEVE